jgi:hypothetical protein
MQTADMIQSALLFVQICVGTVQAITTYFFIKSVKITDRQEKDARNQIRIAQDQMDLAASQYRESLRPLIAVTCKRAGINVFELEFRNEGTGPALNVTCEPRLSLNGAVIGSKSGVDAFVSRHQSPKRQLFSVMYKSLDGAAYWTLFQQDQSDFFVVDYRCVEGDEAFEKAKAYREGYISGLC